MLDYIEEIEAIEQGVSASPEERLLLYAFVKALKPEIVVETGTHYGKTALFIAMALEENGKGEIYTADPITSVSLENFKKFPTLAKRIHYYQDRGENLNTRVSKIDFLFIDSYHEAHIVKEEVKRLFPLLTKHAIVIFHDCDLVPDNGVNIAIEELGLKTVYIPTQHRLRIYGH